MSRVSGVTGVTGVTGASERSNLTGASDETDRSQVTHGGQADGVSDLTARIDVSGSGPTPVSERLGFADLVDRLAAESP